MERLHIDFSVLEEALLKINDELELKNRLEFYKMYVSGNYDIDELKRFFPDLKNKMKL